MLSRREKMIGVLVGASLAILVADWWFIKPYTARSKALTDDIALAKRRVNEMKDLEDNRASVNAGWKKLEDAGMKSDPALGEQQASVALQDWARKSGVNLTSQNLERMPRVGDFLPISIKAKVSGSGPGTGAFLYLCETAPFPMRVDRVQITPTKEGTDDLSVDVSITTVVFSPAPEVKKTKGRG